MLKCIKYIFNRIKMSSANALILAALNMMVLNPSQDVRYTEYLDLRPFMSQSHGDPQIYALYAVLVHSGFSCHAGHYYCYIKVSRQVQTCILFIMYNICMINMIFNFRLAMGSGIR